MSENILPLRPRLSDGTLDAQEPGLVVPSQAERAESIPLVLDRLDGGRFEARFALALSAAVACREVASRNPIYDAFSLEHLIEVLGPEHRIDFVYTVRPASPSGQPLDLHIVGRATALTAEAAERGAYCLSAAMRSVLAGRGDCRFELAALELPTLAHAYGVRCKGLLITTQPKPTPVGSESVYVVLPAAHWIESPVSLSETLLACSLPVEITVSLARARLETSQIRSMALMRDALRGNCARCERLPEREWLGADQVKALAPVMLDCLNRWIAVPRGIAVEMLIRSAKPIDSGALRWLVQPVLPWRQIEIYPDAHPSAAGDGPGADHIDVSAWVNESQILPTLLPDRGGLHRMGLPRSFSTAIVKLADTGIVLGTTGGRSVRMPESDRARHCFLVGATGCGKTTLLLNMILQDIRAGQGVCVIDPHGDLYQDVLSSIPLARARDVVLLDPTDFERAVGLNYLQTSQPHASIERNFVANEMMQIFGRLYDLRQCGGPMFETYMRHALLLLMESSIPGFTLLEVPALFEEAEYRKHLIAHCTNQDVVRFWTKIAEKTEGDGSLANLAPYIVSKLNQFTSNALLRVVVGQSKSTLDLRRILDERKILLVNLAKGLLGQADSALLGMMITSKLFAAALSRARVARRQRGTFNLYVDEFHNFTTDTVAHMLSEARKFGLRAVLANQHLSQIDVGHGAGNLMKAVLGNVGTILAMRVGVADADILQAVFGGAIDSRILQDLPDFHVAARLLQEGRPTNPFVFTTSPAQPGKTSRGARQVIRRAYLQDYTRSVEDVAREIAERRDVSAPLSSKNSG